jgi:hypothetical protein
LIISKDSKGGSYLFSETMSAPQVEVEAKKIMLEEHMLEVIPSQNKTLRRRGRPWKNTKVGGGEHIPTELGAHPVAQKFMMHATRLEPVGNTNRGSGSHVQKTNTSGSNVVKSNQRLEQEKISIDELYQKNRELQRQLAMKNREVSTPQGCEGSTNWLKRQLREEKDMIMQLREVKRMMGKENMKTLQGARSSLGEGPCARDT